MKIALILMAGSLLAAELPKAETLLDRYVEVTGGAAAYQQLRTQQVVSDIEFAGQNIKGTTTVVSIYPDRSLTTMELSGLGKMLSGVWDGIVWESSAIQGQRLAQGAERSFMRRLNDIRGAADWRKYYSTVTTEAEETIDNQACYRILYQPRDGGKPEYAWLAKDSGLLVKSRMTMITPMGEIPMEITVSDYKPAGKLLLPHASTQQVGPQKILSRIREVRTNLELNADSLQPPAEVQPLIAKQKPE